jgi:flagellar motility protein MotE (MotC chaperone)
MRLFQILFAFPLISILSAWILISKFYPLTLFAEETSTSSKDKISIGQKDFEMNSSPQPVEDKTYNVQLDDKGLTLRLDFLNLTSDDVSVLESLFDYRKRLEAKAQEIMKKEDAFQIVETRISQEIGELERIRDEIKKLVVVYDAQEEKKLVQMVKIYENMKPDQAAQIFETLPEQQVLDILSRMKETKGSLILASMPPMRAGQITEKMLQKNAMMR